MIVPVKHLSRSRSRKRRSQKGLKSLPQLQKCDHCGSFKLPHRICGDCGFYRGRFYEEVIKKKEKSKKKK
jgi:large subunit ribosomal protein L32